MGWSCLADRWKCRAKRADPKPRKKATERKTTIAKVGWSEERYFRYRRIKANSLRIRWVGMYGKTLWKRAKGLDGMHNGKKNRYRRPQSLATWVEKKSCGSYEKKEFIRFQTRLVTTTDADVDRTKRPLEKCRTRRIGVTVLFDVVDASRTDLRTPDTP